MTINLIPNIRRLFVLTVTVAALALCAALVTVCDKDRALSTTAPTYLGMAVSHTTSPQDAELNGDGMYEVTVGQDLFVIVRLSNPDHCAVLSLTINETSFPSSEFENDSTDTTIFIKQNAGNQTGAAEYILTAIQYIDSSENLQQLIITDNHIARIFVRAATSTPKIQIEKPTLTTTNFIYNKSAQTVHLSAANDAYTLGGDVTKTNAGHYAAAVFLKDTANYEWSDGSTWALSLTWTIEKAPITVAAPTFMGTLTYGDSLPAITTITTGGSIMLNLWQTLTIGTHDYEWTFIPADTANYTWLNTNGSIALTVEKASQNIPSDTSVNAVMQHALTEIRLTDLGALYEYSYDNMIWQDSPVFTDLTPNSEVTFYARLKETEHYNPSAAIHITRVIAPLPTEVFVRSANTIVGLTVFGTTLANITIPDAIDNEIITAILESAFSGSVNLKIVTIGNHITDIGQYAFSFCSNLHTVTIGNRVARIGESAFNGCTALESIAIPDSVTNIGTSAFSGCTALKLVTIANGVTDLGASVFSGCITLNSVTIPDSVIRMGASIFYGAHNLTSVTIGNRVTGIHEYAFFGCERLISIQIPDSVTIIGERAFSGCKRINSATVGNGVVFVGQLIGDEFVEAWKKSKSDGAAYMGSVLFVYKGTMPYHTTITIPSGTTQIYDRAFYDCIGLISVVIPDSVTVIGSWAFYNCSFLTDLIIPDSVINLGSYAFVACTNLLNVVIGACVTIIEPYTFQNCSSLSTVFYHGAIENWNLIPIQVGNEILTESPIYWYRSSAPTEYGNYWHWHNGIPTVW